MTKPQKKRLKAWVWVYTDTEMKQPIISIDETREIVAGEKRRVMYADPYNGKNERARVEYNKLNRAFYRRSVVVPCTISYSLPTPKKTSKR